MGVDSTAGERRAGAQHRQTDTDEHVFFFFLLFHPHQCILTLHLLLDFIIIGILQHLVQVCSQQHGDHFHRLQLRLVCSEQASEQELVGCRPARYGSMEIKITDDLWVVCDHTPRGRCQMEQERIWTWTMDSDPKRTLAC